ncbi:hypothetical protein BJ912DRAFT_1133131 [Pholiota molesta]|nr:hypothetical protein BJ912DRAFT_1133131 [Pholiota molesta]
MPTMPTMLMDTHHITTTKDNGQHPPCRPCMCHIAPTTRHIVLQIAMPAHHDDGYPPRTTSSRGAQTPRRRPCTCDTSSCTGRNAGGCNAGGLRMRQNARGADDGQTRQMAARRPPVPRGHGDDTSPMHGAFCSRRPLQPTCTHRLHVQSVLHMQHCAAWRRVVPGVAQPLMTSFAPLVVLQNLLFDV